MRGQRHQSVSFLTSRALILLGGLEAVYRVAVLGHLAPPAHAESPAASRAESAPASSVIGPRWRLLRGPSLDDWSPVLGPSSAAPAGIPNETYPLVAVVGSYRAPLYPKPGSSHAIGWAHVGTWLPAAEVDDAGSGCRKGTWYQTTGGAYFCTEDDFELRDAPPAPQAPDPRPDITRPSPFQYVKASTRQALRLERRPTEAEAAAIDEAMLRGERYSGDVVERRLNGTYLIAVIDKETIGGTEYFRTTRDMYVRVQDTEPKPTPAMHGERLGGALQLPMAFVLDKGPLHCDRGGALDQCGIAEKHARFPVRDTVEIDGAGWVLGADGVALPEAAVRIARRIDRPDGIPADGKWVHVDLAKQTLVAYEGDEPVYVTLVSSGIKGFDTPAGLYQVERKYLTKTMRGKDPDGYYEVQEVPWTMYYDGNYAIHGAYWHNNFGRTRSHGCTNVPPADARWLYYWTTLELPDGWHSMIHRRGAHFYFTGRAE